MERLGLKFPGGFFIHRGRCPPPLGQRQSGLLYEYLLWEYCETLHWFGYFNNYFNFRLSRITSRGFATTFICLVLNFPQNPTLSFWTANTVDFWRTTCLHSWISVFSFSFLTTINAVLRMTTDYSISSTDPSLLSFKSVLSVRYSIFLTLSLRQPWRTLKKTWANF